MDNDRIVSSLETRIRIWLRKRKKRIKTEMYKRMKVKIKQSSALVLFETPQCPIVPDLARHTITSLSLLVGSGVAELTSRLSATNFKT